MNLVESILRHVEHLHVRTEFFYESFYDCLSGSSGRDSNALCGNLLAGILEVETHDSMELEILQKNYIE